MRVLTLIFLILFQFNLQAKFELSSEIDSGLLPFSFITAGYGHYLNYQVNPLDKSIINNLDKDALPDFDEFVVGYSDDFADASDFLLSAQILSPLAYISKFNSSQIKTISLMYGETILLNNGLNNITKSLVLRNRPFLYSREAPQELISERDARLSFYSGHSSTAFASAVFNSIIISEHLNSDWKTIGISLNLLNAATIAAFRVAAGKHFLSDVVVGAVVGSGIAYAVTEMHRTDTKKAQENLFPEPSRISFSIAF